MLQCVAVCCNVLQRESHDVSLDVIGGVQLLQYLRMLQYVAVCCIELQCVAVLWRVKRVGRSKGDTDALFCVRFSAVAVCCSVLQCVAVCCSVLQCVAVSNSDARMCVRVCDCVSVRLCVTLPMFVWLTVCDVCVSVCVLCV